jgi:hypothetical protein
VDALAGGGGTFFDDDGGFNSLEGYFGGVDIFLEGGLLVIWFGSASHCPILNYVCLCLSIYVDYINNI